VLQVPKQGSPAAPGKDPHWSRSALKDCSPWQGPTLDLGLRRTEQKRGTAVDLPQSSIPHPPAPLASEAEELGIKEWLRA